MLRMIAARNAEQARSYYTTGLAREDYYAEGQEIAGNWGGRGAELLGLLGQVDREGFHALVENRHPQTGEQLTPRQNDNRRVGYDINFHCPKSVSILHALTGDRGLMDAFQSSVRATMEELEKEMKTRVRRAGKQEDRITGNMVWAEFIHLTARPVEGKPDPHLHAHVFAMNATFDESEDRWKAGQFGDLKRDAPYFEAAFHARLARQVKELGYQIERTDKGWEIAGVSRELIERYSQRTALIEKAAEERGLTSDRDRDSLGASTREKKSVELTAKELRSEWEARLSSEERSALDLVGEQKKSRPQEKGMSPEMAMDWALRHVFERSSAVPEKRLLEAALERGVGSVTVEEIHQQLARPEVVRGTLHGVSHCTTKEVLDEEKALLDGVRDSRGTMKAFGVAEDRLEQTMLSGEQQTAARHVLESMDRVIGIRGAAGTGKTTMMTETIKAIEESGKQVFVFAPSAEASRGVLRKEGFGNAETVARLLVDAEMKSAVEDQVIWIDEAGLLGTRQMKQVFDLATQKNARLILAGDSRQHRAVERGDSLKLLEEKAGLSCAQLGTIRRQQGSYRDAIQAISDGKVEEGFVRLEELGAIHQGRDVERDAELAEEYVNIIKRKETALIVSPTHAEGARVTAQVREGLRQEGLIEPKDREARLPTYHSLGLTDAQKSDVASYHPGQIVEFQLNAVGFRKGERWQVTEVDRDNERVSLRLGETTHQLPLAQAKRFDVFEERELALAPGDLVRVVRNGKSTKGNRLHNGSVHTVKSFDKNGDIIFENGWHVARDFGHLAHGYVLTSYASQGKTVDHVLIAQGSHSWGAANREQFYVSASRGRKSIRVYTDDRDALLDSVLGTSGRLAAHDIVGRRETGIAIENKLQEAKDQKLPEPLPPLEGAGSGHKELKEPPIRDIAAPMTQHNDEWIKHKIPDGRITTQEMDGSLTASVNPGTRLNPVQGQPQPSEQTSTPAAQVPPAQTTAQKLLATYKGKDVTSKDEKGPPERKPGMTAYLYKQYTGKELRVPEDLDRLHDKERGQ